MITEFLGSFSFWGYWILADLTYTRNFHNMCIYIIDDIVYYVCKIIYSIYMYIFVHICNTYTIYDYIHVTVSLPPGARVRPPTNYWVSYQPTIGYLTNQLLLGILPTNYWVSYQPTYNIPFINFSPPWQPMLLMIQVQVQHSFYQCFPPLGNPCLVLGFRF